MNSKKCFTPLEAAQELGIGKNLLYRFLDSGELRSFKLGKRRIINREALDEFRLGMEKSHTRHVGGES